LTDKPRYPNVRCGRSGHADEPGYAVCRHIAYHSAPVFRVVPATATLLGVISCERLDHKMPRDFILACVHCVRKDGLLVSVEN